MARAVVFTFAAFWLLLFAVASFVVDAAPGRSRSSIGRVGGRSSSSSRSAAARAFKAPTAPFTNSGSRGSSVASSGSRPSGTSSTVSSSGSNTRPSSSVSPPSAPGTSHQQISSGAATPNAGVSAPYVYSGAPGQNFGSPGGQAFPSQNAQLAASAPSSSSSSSLAKQALAAGAASAAGAFIGSSIANQMTRHSSSPSTSTSNAEAREATSENGKAPPVLPPDSPTDVILRFSKTQANKGAEEAAAAEGGNNALSLENASALARSVQTAAVSALEIPDSRIQLKALSLSEGALPNSPVLDLTFSLLPDETTPRAKRTLELAEELARQSKDPKSALSVKLKEIVSSVDGSTPALSDLRVLPEKKFFASVTTNSATSLSMAVHFNAAVCMAVLSVVVLF